MDSSSGARSLNGSASHDKAAGDELSGQFSTIWTITLAVLMALLIVATVVGNALVMLAFVVDSSLRTQNNYFLLNLAISDFLVGAFCIPWYIPYVLTGRWAFGKSFCKLWLVMDYLLCTTSVFNIVLISYDRFLSVTRAVSYRAQQGDAKQAVFKMVIVWVLAFLLYGPAIISWEYISGRSIIPDGECYAEFFYNWYFLITASTIEFFTPFISVMFFNLSIYLNIQKRTKIRLDILHESQNFMEETEEPKLSIKCCKWEEKDPATHSIPKWGIPEENAQGSINIKHSQDSNTEQKPSGKRNYKDLASTLSLEKRLKVASQNMTQRVRLTRDKKVAKSLAVIVGIFGLCWAPYTLLMIIRAACHGHCIPGYWYEVSFWLLWINSAINPILYPLCHYSFRRAFVKLLCPKKLKIQPHNSLQKCGSNLIS
ncbi:histamine H3 receptor [Candoia aspera]|uniref:histamine H3 receptor n=1 Tax=Candoia aspera TaxID=51853 RepID=UPI002FD7ABEE